MPEGVEVRPEDLRHGAGLLRDEAGRLDACRGQAMSGTEATASAAGDGPLEGAASAFGEPLTSLLEGVTRSVTECADALEAASAQYLAADHGAATRLGRPDSATAGAPPVVLPGLEPPR